MAIKEANGIANNVDYNQTVPLIKPVCPGKHVCILWKISVIYIHVCSYAYTPNGYIATTTICIYFIPHIKVLPR